ncbi:hypothetical protein M9H77_07220 [Catharanthus roseus]|uniref:Uncharacterized protein n=1 Tax=Catharanthus roseus TaxID=4058 RepID=A0ACC0BUC4_CATRO|nr:hypothetical protein M9H77_07220 [Catharanthus roseus]
MKSLFVNLEEFNCDVINNSSCIDDDSMLLEYVEEVTGCLVFAREIKSSRHHTMIEFQLNDEGGWIVSRHDVSHNHSFCDVNQRHFMCSQRRVTKNNAGYLQELKDSGVSIAVELRVFKEEGWSLMDKFSCRNDCWLNRLYNLREKWSPSFRNDFFFGVVLSSQRSKATNHTIFKRLSEKNYRGNANMEDSCCKEGYVEMMVTESKLLKHANEAILDKYILKRWKKDIDLSLGSSRVGDVGKVNKKDIAGYIFRFDFANELDINARECVEEGFRMMNDNIASEVGPYYVDNLENEVGSSNIKDPVGRCVKGEHNIRKKSIVEIKCNQAKGKRKRALTHASRIKTTVHLCMNNEVLGRSVNFTSSECKISLGTSNYSNVEPLDGLQQFINFM